MHIKSEKEWRVTGKLLGKAKRDAPGTFHKAKNISGIACDKAEGFPRHGLVIDDKSQAAQLVILSDGELNAGERIQLIGDTFADMPLELDGEGVAFENGYFYIIGSHGHPRDKEEMLDPVRDAKKIAARISACSRIVRVSAKAPHEVTSTGALKEILGEIQEIAPFIDQPLDHNGVTIEGLAVKDGRAYVGFRSPLIGSKASVVSLGLSALFDGSPNAHATLEQLDLSGRGIRDITADGSSFLILAGPSAYEDVSFAIFGWDAGSGLTHFVELPPYAGPEGMPWKPEAILSLGETLEGRRILILLDSAPDGAPREILLGR